MSDDQERETEKMLERAARHLPVSVLVVVERDVERWKLNALNKDVEIAALRVKVEGFESGADRRALLAERYGAQTACDVLQGENAKLRTELAKYQASMNLNSLDLDKELDLYLGRYRRSNVQESIIDRNRAIIKDFLREVNKRGIS